MEFELQLIHDQPDPRHRVLIVIIEDERAASSSTVPLIHTALRRPASHMLTKLWFQCVCKSSCSLLLLEASFFHQHKESDGRG